MSRNETGWRVPGYAEVRELGAGAQGRAVLVRHERSGRPYVIKYQLAPDPRAQRAFQDESVLLQQVSSPFVAQWHGHLDEGAMSAILMEAVDGVALKEILARYGKLSPQASLLVLKGSLLGLQAAHERGIVHRDYKPANVVVQQDGLSKLIDFGVATLAGERSGSGTPLYMAPEQWRREPAGPATDVYAATCVFYECVTGGPPFPGSRDAHLSAPIPLEPVPDELRALVIAGLAKTMQDRPPSAAAFVTELERRAVAAYGPDWEQHGINLLGGLAGSLASMFLLAPVVGTAASTGTAAATGTTATSVLTAKATVIVAAGVIAVGAAGTAVYLTKGKPKPPPLPAISFVNANVDENYTQPKPVEIREAAYLTVEGGDPAIRASVNKALRAPLDAVIKQFREYEKCPDGPGPVWMSAKVQKGFTGPSLLTALYTYEMHNYCAGGGNSVWPEAITIDLRTGKKLEGTTLWKPSTLTASGLKVLAQRMGPLKSPCVPPRALAHRPLTREQFVPQPSFTSGAIDLYLDAKGARIFREPGEGDGCTNFTATLPYSKVLDLLHPDLAPLLPK